MHKHFLLVLLAACADPSAPDAIALLTDPWTPVTIQVGGATGTFRGADGMNRADVTGDGLLDVVTPWEQSSKVSISVQASPTAWSTVIVGTDAAAEDAALADLDNPADGKVDVVAGGDGRQLTLYFQTDLTHWIARTLLAPSNPLSQRDMQVVPIVLDADPRTTEILVGGKDESDNVADIRVWSSTNPRTVASWSYRVLAHVAWTMSLIPVDFDGDGDLDVVYSDKIGPDKGVWWLNQVDPLTWERVRIGGHATGYNNFVFLADLDGDADLDVLAGTKLGDTCVEPCGTVSIYHNGGDERTWTESVVPYPAGVAGYVAGVACDLNLDGIPDLAFTAAVATGSLSGLVALLGPTYATRVEVAGTAGDKFDTVICADADADGYPDLWTTEQNAQLGALWYRNPGSW